MTAQLHHVLWAIKGGYRAMTPLAEAGAGQMHIMGCGEWEGHPAGPISLKLSDLQNMIDVFNAQKTPLVVDYDHSAPDRGDTRAAGWIHALELRGDQLWANPVEWTPRAAQMIKDGEYRFNSPYFSMNTKDRVTGKPTGPRLHNVALTNMPFFDGQDPIRLSAAGGTKAMAAPEMPEEKKPEEVAAAEPAADAPADDPMMQFWEAVAKTAGMDAASCMSVLASSPEMADKIGGMVRDSQQAAVTTAAPEAEPEEEPMPASEPATMTASEVAAIKASAEQNARVLELRNEFQAFKASVLGEKAAAKAAADEAAAAERSKRVETMIRCGQLLPEEREKATKLLAFDAAIFETTFGARPKTVPIDVVQAGDEKKQPAQSTLSDKEQFVCSQLMKAGYTRENATKRVIANRN